MPHYKFDQIAFNITDKKMPEPGDEKMYIGLEHLDSGSLKITRWGSEVELTGQKLVMRKGDVLFGRRNTYLRRAAIAPHDGIFSAHGMIFRPKTQVIDPEYFPFFISSNYFMDAAIRISVGSLSPTVNWKTLKELEFDLPSLEEQRKNAALLKSINETKEAYQELLIQTDNLVKSQFIEMFGEDGEKGNCVTKTLQELIDMKWITYHLDGNHGGDYPRADEFVEAGIPYISANCIVGDRIDMKLAKYVTAERAKRFRKGIAENGDVLFAHNATVGPVAILETEEPTVILGTSLTSYRCNSNHILAEYLMAYMKNPLFVQQYERNMQQSTRKQVPITTQRKYSFIIPSMDEQKEFAHFVKQSDKSKFELKEAIKSCDALMKAILFTNLEEKEG